MNSKVKLPVGRSGFAGIRNNGYYYADKSGLIEELLKTDGTQVTLITRPRRFGKTLGMSMLSEFFDIRKDSGALFNGLYIAKNEQLCRGWMNQYPVVFLSFKSVDGLNFEGAAQQLKIAVSDLCVEHYELQFSPKVNEIHKERFQRLAKKSASLDEVKNGLLLLTKMLMAHYDRPVILLLDEYDVPLSKASEKGYYEEMLDVVKGMMQAVKDNDALKFAVLTGCLRISKESIFTGLNNLKVCSVTDIRFARYFGFTDTEVQALLTYYGYPERYDTAKKWYDGYCFGGTEVYCPWDVLNYCDSLLDDREAQPQNYWINTSSNDAVKRFIQESKNRMTKREIEQLVAGGVITKEIRQELTYPEIYQTTDNIFSLLFMTGYLTQRGKAEGRQMKLAIPNLEVRDIFVTQIMDFFQENVRKDGEMLNCFCDALQNGNEREAEKIFTEYLRRAISIRDTAVRTDMKENFYHGILLGILGVKARWGISSNREMGEGYADILAEPDTGNMGIIIEVKYAHDGRLDAACKEALKQIEYTRYEDDLADDGVEKILKYGFACYKKRCRVMLAQK